MDLARETGTIASSIGERSAVFDEHGALLPPKQSEELGEIFWGIIADAFKYSNQNSPSIPPDRSLKDFAIEKLAEKDLSDSSKKLVRQMAEMWGAFVGEPFERQSLKWFFLEEVIDGENLFNASTYKKILDRIAEPALSRANLHLSTTVASISTGTSAAGAPQMVVTTSDGKSTTFDAAILTVPLGCLKHSTPTIRPPVSPRLKAAIHNISYGRLEKAYLAFPKAFWDSQSSDGSAPPHFPFFNSFLHPLYAPDNPRAYNVQCCALTGLSAGPDGNAPPSTLLFYIHGPLAAALGEFLAPYPPGSASHLAAVADFFRPYFSCLPGYDAADRACVPTAALSTDWHRDPLAGFGSYTCFLTPGGEKETADGGRSLDEDARLDEDIVVLRRGMPERGLWLAGEHTAPFVALGTVTGAWWSGEKVAKRVVAWLQGGEDGGWEELPDEGLKDSVRNKTVQVGKGGAEGVGSVSP